MLLTFVLNQIRSINAGVLAKFDTQRIKAQSEEARTKIRASSFLIYRSDLTGKPSDRRHILTVKAL